VANPTRCVHRGSEVGEIQLHHPVGSSTEHADRV